MLSHLKPATLQRLSKLSPLVANTASRSASTAAFDNKKFGKNIVLIDGVRTPFTQSGTDYNDLMAYELQTKAILLVVNQSMKNLISFDLKLETF